MSNTTLSPTIITMNALRMLHNTVVAAKHVNRQYDSSFGSAGAFVSGKIGPSLRIRDAVRFTVSEGSALQVQDVVEEYKTITVSTRNQVAFQFGTEALSTSIDEFSDRYLKPAMAAMASKIDRQVMSLYKDVYQSVGTPGTAAGSGLTAAQTAQVYLDAGAILSEMTTPDDKRVALLSPRNEAATVGALSGLFNSASKISDQYSNGVMGMNVLGYDWYRSSQTPNQVTGTAADAVSMKVKGASQTGASLLCDATTGDIFRTGEVFTVAGVYSVNPESYQSTGRLQQFVVTADATVVSSEVTLAISPAIYPTTTATGKQTVTASPADDALLTMYDTAQSATRQQNLLYHPDAFTLATCDLHLPGGTDFKARETYEGISMRIVRDYDINTDAMPCRLDILSGVLTLRPQYAVRLWS